MLDRPNMVELRRTGARGADDRFPGRVGNQMHVKLTHETIPSKPGPFKAWGRVVDETRSRPASGKPCTFATAMATTSTQMYKIIACHVSVAKRVGETWLSP